MKGALTKTDGSLRTGLISLVIFGILLIIPGIAMQFSNTAEQVMVKVKHQFIAETEAAANKSTVEPEKKATDKEDNQKVKTESAPQFVIHKVEPQPEVKLNLENQQQGAVVPVETLATDTPPQEVENPKLQPPANPQPQEQTEPIVEVTLDESQPVVAHAHAQARLTPVSKSQAQATLSVLSIEQTESITVNKEEYQQLFHAWRAVGAEKVEGEKPALLVENLRQAFDSFNMKPVALKGTQGFDLLDGSRLPDGLLDNYAATVFRIKNPWQDWGTEMKKLGLQPKSDIKVRYYMYDFIHNAIYARTRQAVDWAKDQGLLAADGQQGLEVRGRAFQIKQQGGGRFGVFVPQRILTATGQAIAVDVAAFSGQSDVEQLQQAGLL